MPRPSRTRRSWLLPLLLLFPPLSWGCGEEGPGEGVSLAARILDAEDARGAGPEGLTPLLEGLASPDPELQVMAVRGLGRMEDPDRMEVMAPLLSSPDPEVRGETVNALGQAVFGEAGDRVGDLLLEHFPGEDDPEVFGTLARTLGRLRYEDPATVQRVEETLLGILEGVRSVSPMPPILGSLQGLDWLTRQNREHALPTPTLSLLRELASFRATVDPRPSEPITRQIAARVRRISLSILTTSGGVDEEVVRRAMEDGDADVRRLGLAALRRSPELPGAEVALRVGLQDPTPRVRAQAVATTPSVLPEEGKCRALLDAAMDVDTQVALTALDLLAQPCPQRGEQASALAEAARGIPQGPGPWHRGAHALVALSHLSPEGAAPLLHTLTGHPNPFARVYGARAAGALGEDAALRRLAADADPNVRNAAVEEIFRIRGHGADSIFLAQLTEDDPQLLLTVAGLLEGTPDPQGASGPLLDAFQRLSEGQLETERDPRMGILLRLAEVAPATEIETLRPYLEDFDPVVAREVARILGDKGGLTVAAHPHPLPREAVPSFSELDRLADSRVVLEMAGGGEVEIRLFPHLAPTNASRFARMAEAGEFDGLTFHRVVPNFVVQGLSPHANEMAGHGRYTRDEIGLQSNWRGTVGISTRGRDTGDGQIFINLVDNLRLDHNYTIIGEVTRGMDRVDQILEGDVVVRVRLKGP